MTGLSNSRREGPNGPRGMSPPLPLRTRRGDVEFAKRIVGVQRADVFEIPPGAERSARTVEHGNGGFLVGIEFKKSRGQRICACGVHCVPGFRPIMDNRPNRAALFDSHCHARLLLMEC